MSEISSVSLPRLSHNRRYYFIATLFVLTIGTTIIYPAFESYVTHGRVNQHAPFVVLDWLSTAHVATTAFFYADRDFIPHIAARRGRYIYTPLIVLTLSVLIWGLAYDTPALWYPWQFYHAWLLWHYMRQNIGISALIAQASAEPRLTDLKRKAISLACVGAILGAAHFGPQSPLSELQTEIVSKIGLVIYLGAFMAGLYALWKRVTTAAGKYVTPLFLLAVLLFFGPTFFFEKYYSAIMGNAIAHALQYWFLMSLMAVGSGRTSGYIRSIGSFVFLAVGVWLVIHATRQPEMWGALAGWVAGLGTGITISHFVIDADAWRLREKFQREYVMSRLLPFMKSGS